MKGRRQGGAALILVIWLVVMLAALVGAFALAARIEYMQGRTLHSGVAAEQAARAGLEYAMTRLAEPDPMLRWIPDGRLNRFAFDGAGIEVRIVDESGKIDLNGADATLLSALLRVTGAEQAHADAIAAAIVDWRDPDDLTQPQGGAEDPQYAAAGLPYGAKDAPFETVAELLQVLGMTPALFAEVESDLTVHTGLPGPDTRFSGPRVLMAMGIDPEPVLAARELPLTPEQAMQVGGGSGTYSIDSRARLGDGRQAVLRAVVRSGASGVPGSAYTVLRWEEGARPR
ncbi:MAG: type II secretion system protein GspK [Luteimonas sp.]|nr:type II secretion system protein GspK [Luteimonas sp.]